MIHEIEVTKADSTLDLEMFLPDPDELILMMFDYNRIPTLSNYKYATMIKSQKWNSEGGSSEKKIK